MNLTELIAQTRFYLNEEFPVFWSDHELTIAVNLGRKKVHNLIKSLSQKHFTTRVTFPAVTGQSYYSLPADCKDLKLITVLMDGQETPIFAAPWPDPTTFSPSLMTSDSGCGPVVYWVVGPSIRIVPAPSTAMTFRLYYEARSTDLAAPTDVPSYDLDYHDMAAVWAAILSRPKNAETSEDLKDIWTERKSDLLQDLLTRLPDPQSQVEDYGLGVF